MTQVAVDLGEHHEAVDVLCLFDSLGIQFVSVHEGVDTSTPNGRLVFGIFASIAEFERPLIVDRTKSGIQAAKARGAKIGRPRTHATDDQVRALSLSGTSGRAIAREMGVSEASVRRCSDQLRPLRHSNSISVIPSVSRAAEARSRRDKTERFWRICWGDWER